MSRGEHIRGFDYAAGVEVFKTPAQWRQLEREGYRRQVDGARGETWYRDNAGDLAFEAYGVVSKAGRTPAQDPPDEPTPTDLFESTAQDAQP